MTTTRKPADAELLRKRYLARQLRASLAHLGGDARAWVTALLEKKGNFKGCQYPRRPTTPPPSDPYRALTRARWAAGKLGVLEEVDAYLTSHGVTIIPRAIGRPKGSSRKAVEPW